MACRWRNSANSDGSVSRLRPKQDGALVLVVQSDLLSSLQTRAVIPLVRRGELSPVIARLNPDFQIEGDFYTMATQFIGVVSLSELGSEILDLKPMQI